MAAIEEHKVYALKIRESANDGSDFGTPDADYRYAFLGEDGQLHLKDAADAVTDIGATPTELLDIPTAETDTALVLAPDGAGGVEFRAETGGGGGGTAFIGCKVYHSTTQVNPTTFSYNSEEYDSDAFHDTSTNNSRVTIPAGLGGTYRLTANCYFSGASSRDIWFLLNGTTALRGSYSSGGQGIGLQTTIDVALAAGDYVEVTTSVAGTYGHASDPKVQSSFSAVKLDSGKIGRGIGARAVNSGTQSLADDGSTFTAVAFGGTDESDTDGFHDPASNNTRMTIPAGLGGKYLLIANWYLAVVNGTGFRDWGLRKNGSTLLALKRLPAVNVTNALPSASIETIVDLAAGDYVEAVARQNSGGSTTIAYDPGASATFSIARLDSGSNTDYPPGYEYDYVAKTTATSITGTNEAGSNTIVTGSSVAYDGSTIVNIEFFCPNVSTGTNASSYVVVLLYEDSTLIGQWGVIRNMAVAGSTNMFAPMHLTHRRTPSNASHAYVVKAYVSAGTGSVEAGTGGTGAYVAAYVRVTKV